MLAECLRHSKEGRTEEWPCEHFRWLTFFTALERQSGNRFNQLLGLVTLGQSSELSDSFCFIAALVKSPHD